MSKEWYSLLRCPDCRNNIPCQEESAELHCSSCGQRFAKVYGRPVLIRHDNELFCIEDYQGIPASRKAMAGGIIAHFIPTSSVNLSSVRLLSQLRVKLRDIESPVLLVVGSGSQRKWIDSVLGADDAACVVYSDVDTRADVDLFCDGHELPFQDSSFDAVVATAVLEHVLYPEQVAGEIVRVLKTGGWLYSEIPFMQQVHEGAYDFTRYTLSGHRRLFNAILEIESGMVAGPGTALVWSVENFFLSFAFRPLPRKIIKTGVRILFSWLKYFDYVLADKPQAMDGASCTYLFGQKAEKSGVSDSDIVPNYVGAKHLRHT